MNTQIMYQDQDNLILLYLNGDWIVVCNVTYSAAVTVCKQTGI